MSKASVYTNKGSEITLNQKQRPYQNCSRKWGRFRRRFDLPGDGSFFGGDGDFSAGW